MPKEPKPVKSPDQIDEERARRKWIITISAIFLIITLIVLGYAWPVKERVFHTDWIELTTLDMYPAKVKLEISYKLAMFTTNNSPWLVQYFIEEETAQKVAALQLRSMLKENLIHLDRTVQVADEIARIINSLLFTCPSILITKVRITQAVVSGTKLSSPAKKE